MHPTDYLVHFSSVLMPVAYASCCASCSADAATLLLEATTRS
jgi:hypothetical protein